MLLKLLVGWGLMAFCVGVHASGVASALRWVPNHSSAVPGFWRWTWMFVFIAGWMVLLHLVEVAAFAVYYTMSGAMPDGQTAAYFSAVTYTTTGYGDLVLPPEWRLVGAIEALTGILMCGWSTGFFFAIVSRLFDAGKSPSSGR